MVINFKLRIDKIDSLNYPDILPEEIDLLLNQAQERFVKQRYGTTNPKGTSFEETQKRTEDLKVLTANAIIVPSSNAPDNIDPNAQFVTLPNDHWFIVQERCSISYNDCNSNITTELCSVYNYTHDDINRVINNSFLKANKDRVLRIMDNGKVELIHDPLVTLINYRLRYIRRPVKISSITPLVDCELSEHTHDEIVDQAVLLALEDIESKRLQTYSAIEKTNE